MRGMAGMHVGNNTRTLRITFILMVCVVFVVIGSYIISNSHIGKRFGVQSPQSLLGFGHHQSSLRANNWQIKLLPSCNNCSIQIPSGGYKAWTQGVVSVLEPVVSRNCSLLFANNLTEVEIVKTEMKRLGELLVYKNKDELLTYVKNCSWLMEEFSTNFYTSQEEKDFPLAFAFVVHHYPQQFIRLLKAIYRPHNVYCIHVDKKASDYTKQYVASVSHCLPNVITPKRVEDVLWGHHSLMDAQLSCFSDLYDLWERFQWKYVIPLSGKELPLRTNREIVQMLKPLNGSSGINAFSFSKAERYRVEHKWKLNSNGGLSQTKEKLGPIPHNITLYKSMIFFSLTPDFVDFILHNKTAIDFHKFLTNTFVPEENFYPSLYMIPGVPGGFKASLKGHIPIVSDSIWLTASLTQSDKNWKKHCNSLNFHDICIIGVSDLFRVKYRPKKGRPLSGPMFHNKYFMEVDHVVMDCCEEELVQRNMEEYRIDCMQEQLNANYSGNIRWNPSKGTTIGE